MTDTIIDLPGFPPTPVGSKTWLYLAGPMRRRPEFNFPAFFAAADKLRQAGFGVFNPAELDANTGFEWRGTTGHEDLTDLGFDLRAALEVDLRFICRYAAGVAVLPGWEDSSGARAEAATAAALSLPVLEIAEWVAEAA